LALTAQRFNPAQKITWRSKIMNSLNDETALTERVRRVFETHLAVFDPQSTSNYAELLTDDAVYEFPFAPAEFPSRVEGKEAVAKYMTGLPQLAENWQFWDFDFSATTNPDVFFVEFKGSADAAATGRKYEQTYIGRIEMRGEKMSNYREFWNPQAFDVFNAATP
jgi:uncharacterized protein